jgi:hypothetical protein
LPGSFGRLLGLAGSTKEVGYQANQEQNDKDEKANSGDLSRGESDNPKAEYAGEQCDHEED